MVTQNSFLKSFLNRKNFINELKSDDLVIELKEEQIQQIQKALLEMFVDILEVCQRYDIPIALGGGSALGAVRHKGFIPWDDDLDLNMPREAYTRFVTIFEKELSDRYILNAPNYSENCKTRFPKILKKDTYYESAMDVKDKDQCKLFIDLFIMENVPKEVWHRKVKGLLCNGLEFIAGLVYFKENVNQRTKELYLRGGKGNYYLRMILGTLFSFRSSSAWSNSVDRIVRHNKNTGIVNFPTGRKHYFGEILEYDKLFPLTATEFCGIQAPVFKDVDYYLKSLYGENYMVPPPIEKRERHFIVDFKL